MGQHLADTPLVRRVAIVRLRLRNALEKFRDFQSLRLQDLADVPFGDLIDVRGVVVGKFGSFRSSDHRGTS
jgi:hypothetical protein